MILSVAIERFEHFDDIDSDIDVDVAEKIGEASEADEVSEADEQVTVDFFSILYVDSDVETRRFDF